MEKSIYDEKYKKLNKAIDALVVEEEVLEEADDKNKKYRIGSQFLSFIMREMKKARPKSHLANSIVYPNGSDKNKILITISKSDMIKMALEFFEDLDRELYIKVMRLLIDINDKEVLKIYNYHDVEDFDGKDEQGFANFEETTVRYTEKGRNRIYLVLMEDMESSEASFLKRTIESEAICTYEDLFKLVHEIAHGFDKDEYFGLDRKEILSKKTEARLPKTAETFLSETTAIFFEQLLADYLVNKNPNLKVISDQVTKSRISTNSNMVNATGIKAALLNEKKNILATSPRILDQIFEFYGVNKDKVIDAIIEEPSMYEERKYAFAELLVPSMIKKYREDPVAGRDKIKEYLRQVRDNNFAGALAVWDISFTKKGFETLITNMKEYEQSYIYEFKDIDYSREER